MKVLVGCEESQEVTAAFINRGHRAMSCDINYNGAKGLPHYRGDVTDLLGDYKDIFIAHPVCTFLANSGVKNLVLDGRRINPARWDELEDAILFFNKLKKANAAGIALENPIPHKYARDGFRNRFGRFVPGIGRYSQIIQPWQHGHKEMKATCLWLSGLPLLAPSDIVGPPPKDPKERRKWQKVWLCPPGPDRQKIRSKTYSGIAKAMASQWG